MRTITKGLAALSLLSCAAPCVAAESQPNILWILTDDHRADALACYNKAKTGTEENRYGYVSSPELDKLAKEGTLFTNSYCNSPVSASSRSSMHSGLYTYHRGVLVFEYHHIHPDFMTPTMPEYLKELGYNTMGFGKIGVRLREKDEKSGKMVSRNPYETFFSVTEYDAKNLTDWHKRTIWGGENAGTIQYFPNPDGTIDSYYSDRKDKELTQKDLEDQERVSKKFEHLNRYFADGRVARSTILGGKSSQPSHQTSDGYITQDAQRYLEAQDKPFESLMGRKIDGPKSSQPQMLYMGYHFPHTPVLPSASFRERFKDKNYKLPLFDKEEYDKMPPSMQKWCTTAGTYEMSDKDKESFIRDYYAFCAMGDSLIGATVNSFKDYCKRNKQEYVILITTGDHGWHLGEQGVCAKGQGFISSTHTATILIGSDKKKYPKNRVVDVPMEHVDFLPTFVAAGGGDLSSDKFKHLDGYNLVDVISGKQAPREYVISELGSNSHMRTKDFMFTMQNRRAPKVIDPVLIEKEYKRMMNLPLDKLNCALYDLRVDPLERNNVALDPKYKELAEWFHKKLGTIVLGDERIEVDWTQMNSYYKSSFGIGSDNKKFDAPESIIPKVK